MYSLFADCLPKKIDVARKKTSCLAIKKEHRTCVENKLFQVRMRKYPEIIQCKARAGEMDFKVEGPWTTVKVLSATMVGRQENFLNSRRSRMAKIVTF